MIYLDYNATTPVDPEVLAAMLPFLQEDFGNPTSAHSAGQRAAAAIEEAREQVAAFLGADSASEIVFTSGGTEGNNWSILGTIANSGDKRRIITTPVEHANVSKLCSKLEADGKVSVRVLSVDGNGEIDLDELRKCLTPNTAIVSMMLANNETGVIFPVQEAAKIVKDNCNAVFHVDAVNGVGKIPFSLKDTEIDLLSISAHKFYGPKGVGALFIREGITLPPALIGGGQEMGRRSGTPPTHQIVGLGVAAKIAARLDGIKELGLLRDRLENALLGIPSTRVNGTREPGKRLPNTSNISFENTNGEMIMHRLDELGICVSTGSACHTKDHAASSVLEAMQVPFSFAMGSIRFSLGRHTTEDEITNVIERTTEVVSGLRSQAAVG
ncbi:MAG: aminotransferase class V-fold PLP-dependent enzyme [Acidobacteria bacterium ACB1]|nr:Cysteine desulfurase NifS [Pyrinomonadaceae bacterium]MCE7963506.1 aminotransferase class V-fold PLP-dependent enzyme [Acidobacteria bacterium ACB1]